VPSLEDSRPLGSPAHTEGPFLDRKSWEKEGERGERRKKKEEDQRGQNSLEMRWQKTHLFGAGWTVDADDVNEVDKVEDEGGWSGVCSRENSDVDGGDTGNGVEVGERSARGF